ncbi:MAG: M48 family metalloprotease [Alphaproteobacteria bacterium]|nr:M48 family metalloprotease [Alphaproteobacteria bacterium]
MPLQLIRDRRTLIKALAAGALFAPVAACSENPATGRRQFVIVSDEALAGMAAQTWAEIQRSTPVSDDAALQARLRRVGARVAERSGLTGLDWEFVAFDSADINAFVLPGGKVGFFRGLIDFAQDDGEIAAVMGHEIGHVAARHAAERVSQQLAVQAGVQAAAMALSENLGEFADDAAAALGAGLTYGVILPYSRRHELEADRLGVGYMEAASYAPVHALAFWRRMIADSEARAQPLAWLSTHPAPDDRLEALEALAG